MLPYGTIYMDPSLKADVTVTLKYSEVCQSYLSRILKKNLHRKINVKQGSPVHSAEAFFKDFFSEMDKEIAPH